MGTVDLPPPSVGPLSRLAPKPIKFVLNWGRRYSLWVFNFGLACCAIEFIATSMGRHDFIRLGVIPFAPGPRQADLMVVSGTVSDKMAPAVRRLYEQMPEPKYVISFGACSNCGGPYWDSYCVTKGVDQIIPVDVYVPGCPPRPEALLHGIVHLQEKIAAESLGDRYSGTESMSPPPPPRPLEATVLRRPLQPPPPADLDEEETFGHWNVMADETGQAGADAAGPAPAAGPEDATMPVQHLGTAPEPAAPAEPEARAEPPTRPDDVTLPVPVVEDRPSEGVHPDDETRPVPVVEEPAGPADVTLPVPAVEDRPSEGAHPDDETRPVPVVEDRPAAEEAARPGRQARDRSEHDPSIIPGLTDDGHDDEIGRDR
ncbi:NADH-quinone oxidoreductase subunit B [Actinomadura sp. 6K520]|uniref:NADH-quinone oxidoreductase subunit B n=1 Tax=Actinomadura sp. 6K520 TaxID=2530364 RepID=UPI00104B0A4D|nr:NADH-quinone oxidoreductase subunit B [Actinomadura sp. 6K520]TDE16125.1 NADH-quinone oxidoreductase subunit B [Actinomadura sp. 6K520]